MPNRSDHPHADEAKGWRKRTTVSTSIASQMHGNAHPHDAKDSGIKMRGDVEVAGGAPRRLHIDQRYLNRTGDAASTTSSARVKRGQMRGRGNTKGKTPGRDHGRERKFRRLEPCRRSGNHAAVDNQAEQAEHQVSRHDESQYGQRGR